MHRDRLLRALAVLLLGIAILHIGAIVFYLYWTFWWFDFPVHFLGGAFAALLALWLCFYSGYLTASPPATRATIFLLALGGALSLGIGWEVFERLVGHTWSPEGYWLDVTGDIAFDAAGGLFGFLFFTRRYMNHAV